MNTRFTSEELAHKILQLAISIANKPDAKDSYIILRELKITNEIIGFVGRKHLSFSGIEERFQTPIALALNASYPRLITSGTISNAAAHNAITFKLTQKIFEEKLLPHIEATFKPAENNSFSITDYFKPFFSRKAPSSKEEIVTSPLLPKASTM